MEKKQAFALIGIIIVIVLAIVFSGVSSPSDDTLEIDEEVMIETQTDSSTTNNSSVTNNSAASDQTKTKKKKDPDVIGNRQPSYINVLAPTGGEKLCIGQDYYITWETSPDIEVVSIRISSAKNGGYTMIENAVPSSFNETGKDDHTGVYVWKVGKTLVGMAEERALVRYISIGGRSEETNDYIVGVHDDFFSYEVCEG